MPKYQFDLAIEASPTLEPVGFANEIADAIIFAARNRVTLVSVVIDGPGGGNPCFTFEGTPSDVLEWAQTYYDPSMTAEGLDEVVWNY